MTDQPYQLLPALTTEEYTALKADIETDGIRVPIDVDEAGQILDGHHRAQIADELGIPCPTRTVAGLTEDEKREHAVAVNAHRRHLTRDQRAMLLIAELERDPNRSDRAIARIVGVDHKTVGAKRRGGWGIPQPDPEPFDEASVEETRTRLARAEADVKGGLRSIDTQIVVMLLRGQSVSEVVGWLATIWHQFEVQFADQGEDFLGPVRRVLYTDRINAVLKWPAGPYAEDCLQQPDELRDIYTAVTGQSGPTS